MRKLIFLIGTALCAQTPQTATLHAGTTTTVFALPTLTLTMVCLRPDGSTPAPGEQIALKPNQSSTCTATIDQAAPAGGYQIVPFTIDYPPTIPLTASVGTLVIPAGQRSATFTVNRGAQ